MAEDVLFRMETEALDSSKRVVLLSAPRCRSSSGSDLSAMDAGLFVCCLPGRAGCRTTSLDDRWPWAPRAAGGHVNERLNRHTKGAAKNGYANDLDSCRDGEGGAAVPAAQWDGQRLYWFDEAPPVLQYNEFVRSGYRAGMSYRQCACSILSYHNETGVWQCLAA